MSVPFTCEKCAGEKQKANNAVWKIKYVYLVPGEVKGLVQASWLGNVCNGTNIVVFFYHKGKLLLHCDPLHPDPGSANRS